MPYVDRDPQGRIVGVFAVEQYEGQEFVEGGASVEVAPATTAQQIAELERQSGAPKWMRALALGLMEKEAVTQGATQGLNATQSISLLRAGNPGYRRLKEIDEQITALEAQL